MAISAAVFSRSRRVDPAYMRIPSLAPQSELGGRGSQLGHMPTAGPGDAELNRDLAPLLGRVEQRQQGEATAAKKAGARACQGGTGARKGAASQPAGRVQ
jgi:hypothetical protein